MEGEGLLKFKANELLSDITLTKASVPDAEPIKGHKVVLAAASDLFFDLFTKENQEFVKVFKIPAPVATKSSQNEDPYNIAFSYIYTDQTFPKIKDQLGPTNVFQLYSVAFTLRIKKLIHDLETFIVDELLDSENCINFYLDGIRFKSDRVTNACEKLLIQEFQEICTSKDGIYFLSQLPLSYFRNLMKGDNLNVDNETRVLECVEKYIRHRNDIHPDKTPEEKKAEIAARAAAGGVPIPDPEEEENKKKEEEFKALDDAGKIQWRKNEEVNNLRKEANERMRVRGMRPEDKRELFKTVRFAFLTHQELLHCSRDPLFHEAKEYLVEGLTYKIEPEEVLGKAETVISLIPRVHYHYPEKAISSDLNVRAPQHHRIDERGVPTKEDTKYDDEEYYKPQVSLSGRGPIGQQQKNFQTKPSFGGYQSDNVHAKPGTGGFRDRKGQLSYPPRNLAAGDDTFARADNSVHDRSLSPGSGRKHQTNAAGKSKRIRPQPNWNQTRPFETPSELVYNFDFDENGLFNFLGTEGKKKLWQNPHLVGQVQAFASSIGFGSIHELVGRKCVNLRSLNEPFSFFGVDLGEDRKFLPTCYTIMNRNASTYSLMNWHFEGSNDKLNWTILDRRVYLPDQLENTGYDHEEVNEEIIDSLLQKQGTNTWGVDQNVFNDIPDEGFRYFRIIQISPNSSGTDNLALSCFEIYGKIVTGRFP